MASPCFNDGSSFGPTAANIKHANRLAVEFKDRIKFGTLSMAEYFPPDRRDTQAGVLTVATQLDTWLGTDVAAKSTLKSYRSGVAFWKSQFEVNTPVRSLLSLRADIDNSRAIFSVILTAFLGPLTWKEWRRVAR